MSEQRLDAAALAALIGTRAHPPVHQWQPASCADIDIRIARDGTWYHEGTPIRRARLAALFARLLRRDEDGEYYLVTPAEKLRIRVEDAPFVAVTLEVEHPGPRQRLRFTTSVGDRVRAGAAHPIAMRAAPSGLAPYVHVRDALWARLARPVYYELAELAVVQDGHLGVRSDGAFFALEEHGAATR